MIFSCFVSYRNSSLSSSCSKGFSWIISSTWKHYRCNYSISATSLNILLQLYTVSFSYLHKLNQAVDLNRISLCIFLSFTQVYIPFTGRTLFKILSPPDKWFFHLKTESYPCILSFLLPGSCKNCHLFVEGNKFCLGVMCNFPFPKKCFYRSLELNSFRFCQVKQQIYL